MRAGACAAIAAAAIALTPGVALAVDIPVTSAADSGPGTLRQAITDANLTTASDRVLFTLSGAPQPAIVLGATPLPAITQPLDIDGTTQPNTHRVELNGENVADSGLFIRASYSNVRGLDIHSFFAAAIEISNGASIVTIKGNYIGTNFDGTVAKPNRTGVLVAASAGSPNQIGGLPSERNVISGNSVDGVLIAATQQFVVGNYIGVESSGSGDLGNGGSGILLEATGTQNVIGGTTPGTRNVISGNTFGVQMVGAGSSFNVVQGNYIGTDASGSVAVPNQTAGIYSFSPDNTIGGTQPGAGNVVSGNFYGVVLEDADAARNHIVGNLIGTQADARHALGNDSGIVLNGSAHENEIGRTQAGGANVIAFNTNMGIVLNGGTANMIRANSIYGNGALGIDLGADGITPNDAGDGDSGPNDRQNFPVLDSVESAAGGTRIRGHLDTTGGGMFFVDLYSNDACDPSGNGEGQHWLGQAFVSTDIGGHATFDVTLPTSTVHFSAPAYHVAEAGGTAIVTVERQNLGRFITSTATSTTGNSSEFGPCVEGPGASSVHYATSADGATPGADYTESSGPLDFGATETSKSFSVPIANDQAVEGSEQVTLTLSDPTGAAVVTPDHATLTIEDDDVAVTPPPPPPPDTTPPAITNARVGQRFRIGSLQPLLLRPVATPTGTTISFTLSEPARATFVFKRKAAGRRVRGRCVRPTRSNRRARRCTRRIAAGSFALQAHIGANRVRFQGRIGTRRLQPGRYALELSAVDAAANRSRVVPLSFTLLAARRRR